MHNPEAQWAEGVKMMAETGNCLLSSEDTYCWCGQMTGQRAGEMLRVARASAD